MSFSAFDVYNVILAIVSLQIARERGQIKHHFNARAFRAMSSMKTLTRLEQLAETFASGFGVSCKNIHISMHALGLLMHKNA